MTLSPRKKKKEEKKLRELVLIFGPGFVEVVFVVVLVALEFSVGSGTQRGVTFLLHFFMDFGRGLLLFFCCVGFFESRT